MFFELKSTRLKRLPAELFVWAGALCASALLAAGIYATAGRPFKTTIGDPLALPKELAVTSGNATIPLPPEVAAALATAPPAGSSAQASAPQSDKSVLDNTTQTPKTNSKDSVAKSNTTDTSGTLATPAPTTASPAVTPAPTTASPAVTPPPTTTQPTTAAPPPPPAPSPPMSELDKKTEPNIKLPDLPVIPK